MRHPNPVGIRVTLKPGFACVDDAGDRAVNVKAQQSFEGEVAFANAIVGAVNTAIESEEQRDGEF